MWTDLGWGLSLLGVGLIALAFQALRRHFELALKGFRVVIGGLFILGAVWELSGTTISIVPLLLVIAGVALLYQGITGRAIRRSAH